MKENQFNCICLQKYSTYEKNDKNISYFDTKSI